MQKLVIKFNLFCYDNHMQYYSNAYLHDINFIKIKVQTKKWTQPSSITATTFKDEKCMTPIVLYFTIYLARSNLISTIDMVWR